MSPKLSKTCPTCGKTFHPRAVRIRFCSRECLYQSGRIERICAACGETFFVKKSAVSQGGGKYCSRSCRLSFHRLSSQGTRICRGCGKEFKAYPSQVKAGYAKWCSAKCRYSTPGWEKDLGIAVPEAHKSCICLICGKTFEAWTKNPGHYCSKECLGKTNGERLRGRDPDKWQEYTCKECGKTFTDKKCVAHRKRFCSRECLGLWTAHHRRLIRPTTIELALQDALSQHGVLTAREYRLGRFNIDLAIPERRLAIEADGDYWHSLAKQVRADANKDATLTAAGWTVLRFSETRINTDLAGCVAAVLSAVNCPTASG